MPKQYTFPTLYDEVLQLSITNLKEWGYLEPQQQKRGVLTWSRNGNKIGSISIVINMNTDVPYIRLDYKYGDEPRNYKIRLISLPSNLRKGKIWYFLCPQTKKCCRKLYLVGGYFLHRNAFNGCMYETQTYSKKWRNIERVYGAYFDQDKYFSEINSKHFKKYYNGKPTKRYLKLLSKIKQIENVDHREIELLMIN
ncbi:hypothetical protein LS482_07520 [Sinomicrobium kalidii]|uniref:hypothetical protein n=1 Tax=Sinomicrobium kalidii TaxID=2900738 RepID=UPI001E5E09A5|nr:hypothetical protein [Sinomicrobium kalidii]UGU17717.1 hypothetical protein LS482_07520 [Sinomicrobium kalidii]